MRLVALVAVAAAVAATGAFLPVQAGAASACITTDSALLATVEAKIVRHGTETGRADLHEMFTKSYNTMKGNDGYTTADIKARPDKQGDNWQGSGPNELWQRVYAELDRLEQCRASLQDTTPPVITLTGSGTVTMQKGATYTDAGATCVDDTDGAISPVSSGTVDTTTAGSYTITYSCTDAAGNTATQLTRTVTVQNAQPTPQDTPTILPPEFKFLTMSLPQITEGVPATFTLTSLTAPSNPLDVVVNVQSPSGHLNSTEAGERTITVPTSGSANFTIYTINTPEAKEGTLVVNVTRPAGYTAGPGTIQLGIRDDPTPPKSLLLAHAITVAEGQTVRFTLTSLTALSSPLDVVVNVQSPSGHLNSTEAGERTITIPASGTVNFDIHTINTPAVRDGTLVVNIPDKLPAYAGTVTTRITITDVAPAAPKTPAPSANLVSNGSFETPIISGWSHVQPSTPGLAWTVSGGPLEIHHNILGGASDGSQHAELDSTASITISQTISTISDQEYVISFKYKARPDTAQSTNGLQVTWNGATVVPNSDLTWGNTWQTHKVQVTGTGSDVLSFADAGTSDGIGTFLDDVSVVRLDTSDVIVPARFQDNPILPTVTASTPTPVILRGDDLDMLVEWRDGAGNGNPRFLTIINYRVAYIHEYLTPLILSVKGEPPSNPFTITVPTDRLPTGTVTLEFVLSGTGYVASSLLKINVLDTALISVPGTVYADGQFDITVRQYDDDTKYDHYVVQRQTSDNTWHTVGGPGPGGTLPDVIKSHTSGIESGIHKMRLALSADGTSYTYSNIVQLNVYRPTMTALHTNSHDISKSLFCTGNRISFNTDAPTGGGKAGYLNWYVNGVLTNPDCGPTTLVWNSDLGRFVHEIVPERKRVIDNPSAVSYFTMLISDDIERAKAAGNKTVSFSVHADMLASDKTTIIGKTETATVTINLEPTPPPPPETRVITIHGDTAEFHFAYLGGRDLSLMWKGQQWHVKSEYIRIGERADPTDHISLAGSDTWIGDCKRYTGGFDDYVYVGCNVDEQSHRSEARHNGYAFAIHHMYSLSGVQVAAIAALDEPYVYISTDGGNEFVRVGKLSLPRG